MRLTQIVPFMARLVLPMPVRNRIRPLWDRFAGQRQRMQEIATLGPAHRWKEVQKDEVVFWDRELSGRGEWPEYIRRMSDPNFPLQGYLTVLIDAPPGSTVRILDVGAGPLTFLGTKWEGRTVSITALDPEAAEYDRLLAKHGIIPPCRTVFGDAENLYKFVAAASFDLVHARNCIDHSRDALLAIKEMVKAAKPGCYIYLHHKIREGRTERYEMNHQWDMFPHRGRFYVERPGMRRVDVGQLLSGAAEVVALGASPDRTDMFTVTIRRI